MPAYKEAETIQFLGPSSILETLVIDWRDPREILVKFDPPIDNERMIYISLIEVINQVFTDIGRRSVKEINSLLSSLGIQQTLQIKQGLRPIVIENIQLIIKELYQVEKVQLLAGKIQRYILVKKKPTVSRKLPSQQ